MLTTLVFAALLHCRRSLQPSLVFHWLHSIPNFASLGSWVTVGIISTNPGPFYLFNFVEKLFMEPSFKGLYDPIFQYDYFLRAKRIHLHFPIVFQNSADFCLVPTIKTNRWYWIPFSSPFNPSFSTHFNGWSFN